MQLESEQGRMLCNAVACAAYLVPPLIWDIRTRRIPGAYLLGGAAVGTVGAGIFIYLGELGMKDVLFSLLPGVFLILLGYFTGQKIGYGDGFCFLIVGLMEGVLPCVCVMMTAFVLSTVYAGIEMALHHAGKNTRMPFVPFIFGAAVAEVVYLLI